MFQVKQLLQAVAFYMLYLQDASGNILDNKPGPKVLFTLIDKAPHSDGLFQALKLLYVVIAGCLREYPGQGPGS